MVRSFPKICRLGSDLPISQPIVFTNIYWLCIAHFANQLRSLHRVLAPLTPVLAAFFFDNTGSVLLRPSLRSDGVAAGALFAAGRARPDAPSGVAAIGRDLAFTGHGQAAVFR